MRDVAKTLSLFECSLNSYSSIYIIVLYIADFEEHETGSPVFVLMLAASHAFTRLSQYLPD